jgi:peptidoglycan/xylan/chitin deacetylase (PgdA/CDA1 family)
VHKLTRLTVVALLGVVLAAPLPASAHGRSRTARRAPHRPLHLAVPLVSRVATHDPVIFITIDDGWVRDRAVIDLVHREHIPVTTFLVEQAAVRDPGYFKEIISEGGTVEDHTINHPYLTRVSAKRQTGEICGPLDWYTSTFGSRPALFRPPYGSYNTTTGDVAKSCGLAAVVLWSVDVTGRRVATQGGPLRAGDIVLLHYRKDLIQGLQAVVDQAHRLGLGFAHLEDYLLPHQTSTEQPTTQSSPSSSSGSGDQPPDGPAVQLTRLPPE